MLTERLAVEKNQGEADKLEAETLPKSEKVRVALMADQSQVDKNASLVRIAELESLILVADAAAEKASERQAVAKAQLTGSEACGTVFEGL